MTFKIFSLLLTTTLITTTANAWTTGGSAGTPNPNYVSPGQRTSNSFPKSNFPQQGNFVGETQAKVPAKDIPPVARTPVQRREVEVDDEQRARNYQASVELELLAMHPPPLGFSEFYINHQLSPFENEVLNPIGQAIDRLQDNGWQSGSNSVRNFRYHEYEMLYLIGQYNENQQLLESRYGNPITSTSLNALSTEIVWIKGLIRNLKWETLRSINPEDPINQKNVDDLIKSQKMTVDNLALKIIHQQSNPYTSTIDNNFKTRAQDPSAPKKDTSFLKRLFALALANNILLARSTAVNNGVQVNRTLYNDELKSKAIETVKLSANIVRTLDNYKEKSAASNPFMSDLMNLEYLKLLSSPGYIQLNDLIVASTKLLEASQKSTGTDPKNRESSRTRRSQISLQICKPILSS